MPDDQIDTSDPRWREALAPLARATPPPVDLEERVLASIGAQRSRVHTGRSRWLGIAAAAMLLVALGALLVRVRSPALSPDRGQQYLLLLYEGVGFAPGSVTHAQLVQEYSSWAGELAARGKLVEASELETAEQLASGRGGSTTSPAGTITGFFIVRAADAREAAAIAAGCPHLKYGGEVAIRALRGT